MGKRSTILSISTWARMSFIRKQAGKRNRSPYRKCLEELLVHEVVHEGRSPNLPEAQAHRHVHPAHPNLRCTDLVTYRVAKVSPRSLPKSNGALSILSVKRTDRIRNTTLRSKTGMIDVAQQGCPDLNGTGRVTSAFVCILTGGQMSLRNGYLKVEDAAEAGPEKGGEMTWMRTRRPGSRWRRKETHGGTWGRPLPLAVGQYILLINDKWTSGAVSVRVSHANLV